MKPVLRKVIAQQVFNSFAADALQVLLVGGGSINQTYRVRFEDNDVFCKLNSASRFPHLFQKEKTGLELISHQNIIKTPAVIDCFEAEGQQVLVLEWIQESEQTEAFWEAFGEQMAKLHFVSNDTFGLHQDNYMGSVPQSNQQHTSWVKFLAKERLQPMASYCQQKALLHAKHLSQFEKLTSRLHEIFNDEKPALLHGDLWSGNFMCDNNSNPVLIDPAVYYGHRSIDLAMTTLFGGFRQPFYDAYNYQFPFPANYKEQWAVCNLYPLLIHLYLFGSSYLLQIEQTLKRFA